MPNIIHDKKSKNKNIKQLTKIKNNMEDNMEDKLDAAYDAQHTNLNESVEKEPEHDAYTEIKKLTNIIADLKETIEDLEERNKMLLADKDNLQKAFSKDLIKQNKSTTKHFLIEFLSIIDHFKMGLSFATTDSNLDVVNLVKGFEMVLQEMEAFLKRKHVREFKSQGDLFDHIKHYAVDTRESDVPANTIIHVYREGFMLDNEVLRPAQVIVSRPSSQYTDTLNNKFNGDSHHPQ